MKKKNISLIGCGWLGKSLAQSLIKQGQVILATTSHDKSAEFAKLNIPYLTFDLSAKEAIAQKLINSDVLIYMVPPIELSCIQHFFDQVDPDQKIIFISSTSVYGKNLGDVDEESKLDIHQSSSPLLIETENYLSKRFPNLVILRLGGLYGEKRHPIYFLQGKIDLKTGQELLHLAHRNDCIQAIESVLKNDISNGVYNIVSDLRVKKSIYYTEMANKLSLTPPSYSDVVELTPTRISNEKSKNELKLKYLNPSEFCTFSE